MNHHDAGPTATAVPPRRRVTRSPLASPAARLSGFGIVLALALGGGALVGATLGPEPTADTEPAAAVHGHGDPAAAPVSDELPGGLSVSIGGYALDLRTPVVESGAAVELTLVIEGPDGAPLTADALAHDTELHVVVVGRHLAGYAHVHPTRDADGVWTVTIPPLSPGSYRVFADFVPEGDDGLTLGAYLTVSGNLPPATTPSADTHDSHG